MYNKLLYIYIYAFRCNGFRTIRIHRDHQTNVVMLKLSGMEGPAIDYAIHGHAVAHVPLGETIMECAVSHREENSLLLQWDFYQPPLLPMKKVYVHFEINHVYFDGLHKALNMLSQNALHKLLPNKSLLQEHTQKKSLGPSEKAAIKRFTLDNEYQVNALEKMISSDPRVPFLVLGPFGTGKTHIISATVSALLCNPKNHILVCAYQHQCANSIYHSLLATGSVMRLVPNEKGINFIRGDCVVLKRDVKISDILQKRVIVTTFLTATCLRELEIKTSQPLRFSHILIDEGAQAREPESLGALAVAKEDTKVVIVGDNKQVSPLHIHYFKVQ